jgi:5-deoxy-glucuronate isomerase
MRMDLSELVAGADLEIEAPPGEEAAALLVSGGLESPSGRVARSSPFDPPLAGWFLPPGSALIAHAEVPTTVAIVTTKGAELGDSGREPVLLERAEAEVRGRDEWERSVVTLVDTGCGSRRLIAGQTTHASGGWSSYPPHRHDGSGGEPYFEEIYHYRFDPEDGFGFQGLYGATDDRREAHLIRDGDTLTIDRGYHPVCAAPGYRFTYFWCLCGPAEDFHVVEDREHVWVEEGLTPRPSDGP